MVHFRSDEEEEEESENKKPVPITSFFGQNNKQTHQKTPFFDDRCLVVTTTI